MCYQVKCSKCGKTSWGGCGLHVRSVHEKVPQGQHCLCKSWPGVPSAQPAAAAPATAAGGDAANSTTTSSSSTGTSCSIM